ncbi:MAG TPA: hypothetical protein VFX11_10560 [Candidatus Kapabacteria bacterium]|nr:hypothetical protein [Candidatus Kapabacteria bacterium]
MQPESKKPAKSKSNDQSRKDTSQTIAEQTKAFLKAGGQVTRVKAGVSGKPFIPTKNR